MKAKLIKTEVNYLLENQEGVIIASTSVKKEGLALSLNNCLEIENGYDLSALFCEVDESIDYHEFDFTSFRLGFQKALEILNKKFSEEDMIKISEFAKITSKTDPHITPKELVNLFTQSLQQTEWDVWVVMACGLPDGCTEPEVECTCDIIPSLDHDGCLILKRV